MQAITADKDESQSKLAGYIGTAAIHAAILGLMWFIVLTEPDPPLTDSGGGSGVEISLGDANMGGSSEVPVETMEDPTPTPPQQQTETPVVVDERDADPDAVVTQPKETPKVEPKKQPEKKPEVTKPVEQPKEKPRQAEKGSLFTKRTTTADQQGNGYGTGDQPGNQGDESGSENGKYNGNGYGSGGEGGIGTGKGGRDGDGTGPNSGPGFSIELKDRKLQRRPNIEDRSKETGKQVISIVVDRNGKVIKAMPNQRGSTNPKLAEVAKQAAMDMKFSPKPDAPDEQYGTVTIEFKFKP